MSSPSKGCGRRGTKRNTDSPVKSPENSNPAAKARKKTPARKRVIRPKQRGRYKPKPKDAIEDALPPIGVRDSDLVDCIFSDEEEREEFLQDCPQDLPLSGSTPSHKSCLLQETDINDQDCSTPFSFLSPGDFPQDLHSVQPEELSQSSFISSVFSSTKTVSTNHASDLYSTDQSVTQESCEDLVSDASDVLQSKFATPTTSDSVKTVESLHRIDEAVPSTEVILKTVVKFRETLPPMWVPVGDKSGLHLYRFSTKLPSAVQREVFLPYHGDPKIYVHCKVLPFEVDFLKTVNVTEVVFSDDTIDEFCAWGVSIAKSLEQYSMCIAADILELKEVWGSIPNSTIDQNPYQEDKYSETCRSTKCSLLIPLGRGKRCSQCTKLLRSLKSRRSQLLSKNPHPCTPNIHLTYEQAIQKLKIQHQELRKRDSRIAYLEGRYRELLDKEGVDIESSLSTDLGNILANNKLNHAQEIFFREQFNCSAKADPKAHRWHPYMIRLALHLHMTSPAGYEALKNSGAVKLPSSRTLYDYSHAFKAEVGISDGILKMAKTKIGKYSKSHQAYVSLMADEMHISKNLVYRESDGKLFGFVHLDKVEEEMEKLEKELKGDAEMSKPNLATAMLAFMIKGCTSDVKYVIASYPVSSLSRDVLYTRTWNLISRLERAGIKVLAFVSDGCAANRAFINMHTPVTKTKSGVIFDTINFCSSDRRILYFISDVAHLLKTIRNSFYGSGEGDKKTRCLEIRGEKIVWKTIIRLYLSFKQCTFRKSYKLNSQNVFPNSYSIMRVKLAAEVLSDTVALDLEQQCWPSTTETVRFIRYCNKFFDCLNGAHTGQHIRTRNQNLAPYTDISDSRFEWLEEFLKYLEDWETDVKMKFNPEEWSSKQIARPTLEGIEMSIKGIRGATTFLLKEGASFVNPRTFSQDHLEQHFSLQRAGGGGGGSTNPNTFQFLNKQVSLSVQRELGMRRSVGISWDLSHFVGFYGKNGIMGF